MTTPLQPDPPKFVPGSHGLSDAWQRYFSTPYVSDTLARLVGKNNPPVQVSSMARPPGADPRLQSGTTNLGTVQMYINPDDGIFTHELGHVLDMRSQVSGDGLEVTDSVRSIFNKKRPSAFTYESATGNLPAEYVAETFRMAMEIVRSSKPHDPQIQKAESRFPGTQAWYNWIQQRLNGSNTASTTP